MERAQATVYLAFLLRLWREDETMPWRAMVINPHTEERRVFTTLEMLFVFLRDQTDGTVADVQATPDGKNAGPRDPE